jgi:hypothetical protein
MTTIKCNKPLNLPEEAEWDSYTAKVASSYGAIGLPVESSGWLRLTQAQLTPIGKGFFEESELSSKISDLLKAIRELLLALRETPTLANVCLRDLGSEKYRLKEKIEIIIEEYHEETIAKWPELELFGYGISPSEAIMNLKNEIIDLYEDLSSTKKEELGKLPKMWLSILKKIIIKK